jgi:hypothetical protein
MYASRHRSGWIVSSLYPFRLLFVLSSSAAALEALDFRARLLNASDENFSEAPYLVASISGCMAV